jgi:hypothetical protein
MAPRPVVLRGLERKQVPQIPPINIQNKLSVRRRFQASGAVSGILHLQDILNQFLVATTSTTLQPSVEVIRVKSIEMWSNQSVGSATAEGFVTLVIEGNDSASNNFTNPPFSYTDTSNSTGVPAYLKKNFSIKDGPVGSWHYTDNLNVSQPLVSIACSPSSTVDIVFEIFLNYSGSVRSWTSSTSGANVGGNYARVPITNLTPFGVNFI